MCWTRRRPGNLLNRINGLAGEDWDGETVKEIADELTAHKAEKATENEHGAYSLKGYTQALYYRPNNQTKNICGV